MEQQKVKLNLFISYSHDDDPYFKIFSERLRKVALNAQYFDWNIWDDTRIYVGTFWDDEIQKNIKDCNVAFLLVSVGFMASSYIEEKEYNEFKKKYEDQGILIVPVVFSPCDFNRWEDLGKLQFFKPRGSIYGKPDIENFTFSDLIKFNEVNGILIPNPNINRFILDLVKKTEESFKDFLKSQETGSVIDFKNHENYIFNRLSTAPIPRPYFTGRENEIAEFKNAIDAGIKLITIDGAGGIGKTQFVSKCIEKYIHQEKVIWYECTPASQFDTLISEAGYPDLLKGSSKTDKEKFSAFKDKIQENGYFLFLDNFQETNTSPIFREFLVFIQEYLHSGCVVVIDRDDIRSASLTPKRIHIEGFKEKKLEYAKALIAHSFADDVRISDVELETLCDQLQGYPLAIDFAIYLLSQGETPSEIFSQIVQQGTLDRISERLLNAIFSRPDATEEEKDFILQFSVFTGSVSEQTVMSVISDSIVPPRQLQRKNLLSFSNGFYEIHPLVREFCYKELINKEKVHSKVAEYFIKQRTSLLSPVLEEQIFYHLSKSKQWEKIEKEVEDNGRQFILFGQLGLVKEFLDKLKIIGIEKPIFNILYGDIAEIQGKWDEAYKYFDLARLTTDDNKVRAEGIIKFGEMLHRKGRLKEALILYEEALSFSKDNDLKKEEARALNDIGIVYGIFGNLTSSHEKYVEALNIRTNILDKAGIATTLNNIGILFDKRGDLEKALIFHKDSLKIQSEIGNKSGIADSINGIAKIFASRGEIVTAVNMYEQSINIAREIGNKSNLASYLGGLGFIYAKQGELNEAMIKYDEGLKITREIGNTRGIAISLRLIGHINLLKGSLGIADKLFKESLEIETFIGNKEGEAVVINEMANLLLAKNKFHDALNMYERSLQMDIEMGAQYDRAITLSNIGIVLKRLNKLEESLEKNKESLIIMQEIGDQYGINNALFNIGSIYSFQGKLDESINSYFESLEIAEKIDNALIISDTCYEIGCIYSHEDIKKYDLALTYFLRALSIDIKIKRKKRTDSSLIWISSIRDHKLDLKSFKLFINQAFEKLNTEMQSYINLDELMLKPIHTTPKIGRNDPCPCGSGKKYKQCHGR